MIETLMGKKIGLLGFGKEGQATLEYLRKHDIPVAAILDKEENLNDEAKSIIQNTKYIGGENYLNGINEFDFLFRSPGLPRLHPKLQAYPNQEAIYSHTKLFFELCPCPIIAVTGTKGKTTTTSLIFEIMKAAGKNVYLGGNVGIPPLSFVDDLNKDSLVVLELSSFQTMDLQKSPHVGVILTVTSDHLDDGTFRPASHSSIDEYYKAKAQLIAHQTSEDFAILHSGLGEIFKNSGRGKKIFYDPATVQDFPRKLLGQHNLENIAAGYQAAVVARVEPEVIKHAIAEFSGVPQRLQVIVEKNGIKYVNDSASTNPDSTSAAIDAFSSGVVLIIGGFDKGLDYSELGHKISSSPQVKAVIAIGQLAPVILQHLQEFKGKILTGAKNMQQIVEQANSVAENGDVVLLSPAAASFDMFKNSKDRGNQFDQIVTAL